MKKTILPILAISAGSLAISFSHAGELPVRDDFGRADSIALGTASDGKTAWREFERGEEGGLSLFQIKNGRLAITGRDNRGFASLPLGGTPPLTPSGTFKLSFHPTATGSGPWLKFSFVPHGKDAETNWWLSDGWMFRWQTGGRLSLGYYFDGKERPVANAVVTLDPNRPVAIEVALSGDRQKPSISLNGVNYSPPELVLEALAATPAGAATRFAIQFSGGRDIHVDAAIESLILKTE